MLFAAVTQDSSTILIGACVLIAAYMTAALFFRPLRFIFRMKRGFARILGIDEEGIKKLADVLAFIFCPIIAIGAVGTAMVITMESREQKERIERIHTLVQEEATRRGKYAEMVLNTWEVRQVSFGPQPRYGVGEDEMPKVHAFISKLRENFHSDDVPPQKSTRRNPDDEALTLKYEPAPSEQNSGRVPTARLSIDPVQEALSLKFWDSSNEDNVDLSISVPPEAMEEFAALKGLTKVDLKALEREKRIKKEEEENRYARYELKTREGVPAYEIRNKLSELSTEQRKETGKEYLGMQVDWEVRVAELEEKVGDPVKVQAHQFPPKGGASWTIYFETSKESLAGMDESAPFQFARIKGTVVSLEKGIHVEVTSCEGFAPEL